MACESNLSFEIEPVYVTSIGELIEVVTDASAGGQVLWYRGHRSASWHVIPSIWRGYTPADERNLTNRFCSRAAIRYSSTPAYDADASWLSLMQHYGLPTRLLDWTRSPLVATYFALQGSLPKDTHGGGDAAVWALYPHRLNVQQGLGPVTPSIEASMCREMIRPAFTDKYDESGKIMAVMASETDLRMFVQQGCFTVHSNATALNKIEGHSNYLWPIVIRAEYIPRVALEVAACGFRQGDLFPDLGNLAEELKRTYPPGIFPG